MNFSVRDISLWAGGRMSNPQLALALSCFEKIGALVEFDLTTKIHLI